MLAKVKCVALLECCAKSSILRPAQMAPPTQGKKVMVKGLRVIMGARKPRYGANQGVSKGALTQGQKSAPEGPASRTYFAYKNFGAGSHSQGGIFPILSKLIF
jgi:hypothetical protein